MPQTPKWTKVQISGSNFEVNSLTSSIDLGVLDSGTDANKPMVFRDPITGGWEATSSIKYKESLIPTPLLDVGNNNASHSVNVPDSSITASTVGVPVEDPSNGLISFPSIFKNATYGGFEHTASVGFEPVLEFYGIQTTNLNNNIKSGSTLEGPSPAQFATFPLTGQTDPNFPLTFANTWIYDSATTYIDDGGNGAYMKFDRGMPVGTGITASFEIPFYYQGGFQSQDIKVQLRRWLPNGYSIGGEWVDEDEITVGIQTFRDNNGWDDFTPQPVSASFTGSWEILSTLATPIQENERWQLRIRGNENYSIGYNATGDASNVGNFTFEITGSTATPGPQFTGNLSGSFIGDMYGGYSGSLTGISLNSIPLSQGLTRGNGLLFYEKGKSGTWITTFKGDNPTDAVLRLYPANPQNEMLDGYNKSGFTFPNLSESEIISGILESGSLAGGLELGDGLAGTGLSFSEGSNKEILSLDLDTNSGLTVGNTRLKINDSILGNGLEGGFGSGQPGSMSVDLTAGVLSGLAFGNIGSEPDAIALATGLPGLGLKYGKTGDHSEINIDTNEVVITTGYINLKSTTSPQTLAVANTDVAGVFDNSINVTYDNNASTRNGYLSFNGDGFDGDGVSAPIISKNIEITGSVLVKGDFTVVSGSNVTNIWAASFETTDQFLHINSGSATTAPFSFDNGGFIIQTSSTTPNASGSAIWYDSSGGSNLTIGGHTFYRAGWGLTTGGVPWDAQSPFSPFDTAAAVGDVTASNYAANMSMVKIGVSNLTAGQDPNTVIDSSQPFYDHTTLDNLGSWYIDTGSDPAGNDSNVYIYGIFD